MRKHTYTVEVEWMGNKGKGTLNYKSYTRDHKLSAEGKYASILASSDSSFLGDEKRYNPEEMFLSSISSCHMLWYLHLCSVNNIVVEEYLDNSRGVMEEHDNGSGRFIEVTLYPIIRLSDEAMISKAKELHSEANKMCFIANSCNFEIKHVAKIFVAK